MDIPLFEAEINKIKKHCFLEKYFSGRSKYCD